MLNFVGATAMATQRKETTSIVTTAPSAFFILMCRFLSLFLFRDHGTTVAVTPPMPLPHVYIAVAE